MNKYVLKTNIYRLGVDKSLITKYVNMLLVNL